MSINDLAISLAVLRNILGYSQGEVAERSGVANSAISDYERGKVDPQTHTLQRLLHGMGLRLSTLEQTQAFILAIRSQVDLGVCKGGGEDPAAALEVAELSPRTRELRMEIAHVAMDGGRFAARLLRLLLELLAGPLERQGE